MLYMSGWDVEPRISALVPSPPRRDSVSQPAGAVTMCRVVRPECTDDHCDTGAYTSKVAEGSFTCFDILAFKFECRKHSTHVLLLVSYLIVSSCAYCVFSMFSHNSFTRSKD